jgi:hypothetical protein
MLFTFQKYFNPTSYFNLLPNHGESFYLIDIDSLDNNLRDNIILDKSYSTIEVSKLDSAYQLLYSGFILTENCKYLDLSKCKPTITDNYIFISKFYKKIWCYYVLIIRLLTLKNLFVELKSFIYSFKVKKINNDNNYHLNSEAYIKLDSVKFNSNPFISIVIPTLNRYQYLFDALKDLENQAYKNFEVIIVDQSDLFIPEFYNQFNLNIKLFHQVDKALWKARNMAIENSNADFIAFYEDDIRVKSDWLTNHIKCINFFNADISAGILLPNDFKEPNLNSSFKWAEHFASGNSLVKRNVFKSIGLFDLQFERMRILSLDLNQFQILILSV